MMHLFSALLRLVSWGEDAGWRERLVSCQLCHRDHQPHRHGEQCATNEAPAQRDQRLSDSLATLVIRCMCK